MFQELLKKFLAFVPSISQRLYKGINVVNIKNVLASILLVPFVPSSYLGLVGLLDHRKDLWAAFQCVIGGLKVIVLIDLTFAIVFAVG